MKEKINPLGFLGFVGLIGVVGIFAESRTLLFYFPYLGYLYYFTVPYESTQRTMTLTALALAYVMAFTVNLGFIVASGIGGEIDYQSGFYLAYMTGSFGFPVVFGILKVRKGTKRKSVNA